MTQTRAGDAAFVETPDLRDLPRHESAWRNLAARAAEPNVFGESDFLIPALARLAPSGRIVALLVWSDPTRQTLIGVAAIETPRLPLGLARVWLHKQAALPAILVDRDAAENALRAILAWLATARGPAVGLRLPSVEAGGPLAQAAAAVAAHQSLRIETLYGRRRAALPTGPTANFEANLDKKRRKEWARQRRRLEERGRLESLTLDGASGVEPFLALESRGWKGMRGSALAIDSARAAFTREMLARFAARGALRVESLALDGEPIAIGLALRSGERAFYWKTAYDERFAEYSPGLLLTLDLSRRLERESGLTLVDSCAAPDHPMIERLWRARLEFTDLALALRPGERRRFALTLAAARARERLKGCVKRIANRLLRRKSS